MRQGTKGKPCSGDRVALGLLDGAGAARGALDGGRLKHQAEIEIKGSEYVCVCVCVRERESVCRLCGLRCGHCD